MSREALVAVWRDDPVRFANDVFTQKPREVQPQIMSAVAKGRWTSVAACRDMGKSRLAAYLSLWFLVTRPNSLVFTCAPVWSQVEEALWAEIRGIWQDSILPKLLPTWEVQNAAIKTTDPRWRALGVTSKDVQNIEGRHGDHVLVVLDESKGIQEDFFNSVQGMLSQKGSKLLAIGTPGPPRGWFARSFSTERHLWDGHFKVRADSIPRLAPHCENERRRLGEDNPWYRQQQLAEFAGADEFSLFPIDKIEASINREMTEDVKSKPWLRVMGLDPAGRGSDDSVLTYRVGPVVLPQETWKGWDEMRTAHHVVQRIVEFKAQRIAVDEIGIGAGILSRIRQLLKETDVQVIGFNAGHSPRRKDRFMNKKVEQAFLLRDRFLRDEISLPDDPELIGQLCSWQTDFTAAGKTKLIDPPDSPDRADSLLISFAAETTGVSVRQINSRLL